MDENAAKDLSVSLQELSNEFDERGLQRHQEGAEKYGPLRFVEVDTVEEALAEILDLSNYLRYTYLRLRLLQMYVNKQVGEMPTEIKLGAEGFNSNKGKRF